VTATSSFDVDVMPDRAFVRVRPVGEVDLSTSPDLRAQLDQLWDSGWTDIVVDLRDVTFMDSSGVHVLLDHHRRAARGGMSFAIIDGAPSVSRLLSLTGLDALLTYASVDRLR
jgi:anti-anti-sigma factor